MSRAGIWDGSAQPVFDAKARYALKFANVVGDHGQVTRSCLARKEEIKRSYGLSLVCKRRSDFTCGNCVFLIQLENGKAPQEKAYGFQVMINTLAFVSTIVKLVHHND